MPYKVQPEGGKFKVVSDTGKVFGTHDTEEEANDQVKALYANTNEEDLDKADSSMPSRIRFDLPNDPDEDDIAGLLKLVGGDDSVSKGTYSEEQHPRDKTGKWTGGQGEHGSAAKPPKEVRDLRSQAVGPKKGFTYQPVSKRSPSEGLALSIYPERGKRIPRKQFSSAMIQQFIQDNQDLLQDKRCHVGGWYDTEHHEVDLDISVLLSPDDHDGAVELCKKYHQEAYYSLHEGKEYQVGARDSEVEKADALGKADWDESKHKRADSGEFAGGAAAGQSGGKAKPATDAQRFKAKPVPPGTISPDPAPRKPKPATDAQRFSAKPAPEVEGGYPGYATTQQYHEPKQPKMVGPQYKPGDQIRRQRNAEEMTRLASQHGAHFMSGPHGDQPRQIKPSGNGEFDVEYGPGDTKHFRSMADLQRRHGLRNEDIVTHEPAGSVVKVVNQGGTMQVLKADESAPFQFFIPITKIDTERREVWGYGAKEEGDNAREILDWATSRPHFVEWSKAAKVRSGGKSLGNVREMHNSVAAGKLIEFRPDDVNRGPWVGAKIVDDAAWKKVQEGVYTGFSVGGSYINRWTDPANPEFVRYTARPVELSLVDAPCIPSATFQVVKANGVVESALFKSDGLGKSKVVLVKYDGDKDEKPSDEEKESEALPDKDEDETSSPLSTRQGVQKAAAFLRELQAGLPHVVIVLNKVTAYTDAQDRLHSLVSLSNALDKAAAELDNLQKAMPTIPDALAQMPNKDNQAMGAGSVDALKPMDLSVDHMPDPMKPKELTPGGTDLGPGQQPTAQELASVGSPAQSLEDVAKKLMAGVAKLQEAVDQLATFNKSTNSTNNSAHSVKVVYTGDNHGK